MLALLVLAVGCGEKPSNEKEKAEKQEIEKVSMSSYDFMSEFMNAEDKDAFLKKYRGKIITLDHCLVEGWHASLEDIILAGYDGSQSFVLNDPDNRRYADFNGKPLPHLPVDSKRVWLRLSHPIVPENADIQPAAVTFDVKRDEHDNAVVQTFHSMLSVEVNGDSLSLYDDWTVMLNGAKINAYETY